ncbi:MAG: hypothetical protein NZ937_09345 [Armatimonadetes bacterium]|nr:hypothetical protein [Armatimonadota bacterium]
MRYYYVGWVIIASLFLLQEQNMAQLLQPMTREAAAQIVQGILQAGQFPGNLYWTTTHDLPAQQEVAWYNTDLFAQLAKQGKACYTIEWMNVSWFHPSSSYEEAYIFPLTFNPIQDRVVDVYVNRWTGYLRFNLPRKNVTETNNALGLGNHPALTLEQQRVRALEIAQKVLGAGTFIIRGEFPPPKEANIADWGTAFLIYKIDPQTNARLLKSAIFWINARTGWLESATVINRPTTVSTTPSLTLQQARDIVRNYLSNLGIKVTKWVDDYVGGRIYHGVLLPDYVDTGLFVVEDGLLQQHLVWQLVYIGSWKEPTGQLHERAGCELVNAHTGAILEVDFAASVMYFPSPKTHRLKYFEIYNFAIDDKITVIIEPLLLWNGRIYIWEGYAGNLGVKWDGKRLIGKQGSILINPLECLSYKGRRFLPLRRLCKVIGIYPEWNNRKKELNLQVTKKPVKMHSLQGHQNNLMEEKIPEAIERLRLRGPVVFLSPVELSFKETKKTIKLFVEERLKDLPLTEKWYEYFKEKLITISLKAYYGKLSPIESEREWQKACDELEEILVKKSTKK